MITKDNIAEVLKHNNLKFKLYRNCIQLNNDDYDNTAVIDLDHVNLIPIIEAHYGRKLEPLPEANRMKNKIGLHEIEITGTGEDEYCLEFLRVLTLTNLTRKDLFTISVLIQKVLSGIEE